MPTDESMKDGLWQALGDFIVNLPNEVRANAEERIAQKIDAAVSHTRCRDIELCAAAMLDAGVKPDVIARLLQRYWGVDREDANFRAWQEGPRRRLEEYLVDQGMARGEARIEAIHLRHMLMDDPSLAQKALEAQRKAVEKDREKRMAEIRQRAHSAGEPDGESDAG